MGTDIGYLQTKIRELQDKNKELDQKVEDSLQREKRFNDNISHLINKAKTKEIYSVEELVSNAIKTTYEKQFKRIFEEHAENISKSNKLSKKAFNLSVDSILKEIILLKKDSNFLINLVNHKLKISPEEFSDFCRKFDKAYPSKQVKEDLEKFRMKLYTNQNEIKKWSND